MMYFHNLVLLFVLENGKAEAEWDERQFKIMITITSHDLSDNYDHEIMISSSPPILFWSKPNTASH